MDDKINMKNERLLEYFCAKYMLFLFTNVLKDETNLLFKHHIKVEIIRFAFNLMDESDKSLAFDYLINIYKETRDDDLSRLHQIVNFLPRLKNKNLFSLLYSDYIELKKRSFYDMKRAVIEHCLIQLGDKKELEEEYYKRMIEDPRFDSFVRGGYLVYFKEPLQKIAVPYFDEFNLDWDRVFNAFKDHIYEDKKNDYRKKIRRIEFRVAKQYIESRKNVLLEVADFYKNLTPEYYNFNEVTKSEYYMLCDTIKKYEK